MKRILLGAAVIVSLGIGAVVYFGSSHGAGKPEPAIQRREVTTAMTPVFRLGYTITFADRFEVGV